MEKVNCPLCNSRNYDTILRSIDIKISKELFNVVMCSNCGFKFTNPRPSFDEIGKYYGIDYYAFKPLCQGISSNMERNGKTYLDIGCGSGRNLMTKYNKGYDVYGIDINEIAIATGKALGLKIFKASPYGKLPFKTNFFDEINLNNSLEHIHDLHGTISECFRCLKIGGAIKIEVPNIDSYEANIYGSFWRQLDLPRHLHHFSPNTAIKLLKMNAFRHIEFRTYNIHLLDKDLNYLKARFTTLKLYIFLKNGLLISRIVKGLSKIFISALGYPFHNGLNEGVNLEIWGSKG
jgi:SAM-dependent methyltransferase